MKTLLVALLLLVFGTAAAFAECAWVFWVPLLNTKGIPIADRYSPSSAFNTPAECEKARSALMKADLTSGSGSVCLPDTVDPRGTRR